MNDYLRSLLLAGLVSESPPQLISFDDQDVSDVTVQRVANLVEFFQADRVNHLIVKLIDGCRSEACLLCKPRLCPPPFAEAGRQENPYHCGTLLLCGRFYRNSVRFGRFWKINTPMLEESHRKREEREIRTKGFRLK